MRPWFEPVVKRPGQDPSSQKDADTMRALSLLTLTLMLLISPTGNAFAFQDDVEKPAVAAQETPAEEAAVEEAVAEEAPAEEDASPTIAENSYPSITCSCYCLPCW